MHDAPGGLSSGPGFSSGSSYLAKIVIFVSLISMIGLFLFVVRCGQPEEAAPRGWERALLVELGDAELRVLQVLGPPACKAEGGDGEAWIYPAGDEERSPCVPSEGDLVIRLDDAGEVVGYDPEHGRRTPVHTDVDQLRFRGSVGAAAQ